MTRSKDIVPSASAVLPSRPPPLAIAVVLYFASTDIGYLLQSFGEQARTRLLRYDLKLVWRVRCPHHYRRASSSCGFLNQSHTRSIGSLVSFRFRSSKRSSEKLLRTSESGH